MERLVADPAVLAQPVQHTPLGSDGAQAQLVVFGGALRRPGVPRHLASGHIASSARSPPRSATASGLALARELIQAQGGTVDWREASPGTVFVATLAWQN
jgi:hypothetical protein